MQRLINTLSMLRFGRKARPLNYYSSVFISHSHADKSFARRIKGDLERHQTPVWLDEGELSAGDALTQPIVAAIAKSDYTLVVASQNSTQSDWVVKEVGYALTLERTNRQKKLIPIRIEPNVVMPQLADRVHLDMHDPELYRSNLLALLSQLRPHKALASPANYSQLSLMITQFMDWDPEILDKWLDVDPDK
jgi:TIR domain